MHFSNSLYYLYLILPLINTSLSFSVDVSSDDSPVLLLNGYRSKDSYSPGEDVEVFCATHASARPLDIDIQWSGSGIQEGDGRVRWNDFSIRLHLT